VIVLVEMDACGPVRVDSSVNFGSNGNVLVRRTRTRATARAHALARVHGAAHTRTPRTRARH
jgi:hypothetical protein